LAAVHGKIIDLIVMPTLQSYYVGAGTISLIPSWHWGDIAYEVLLDTGVLIQPLPIWEDEWKHPQRYKNPALLQHIDSEGIRL
jgi:hypothetical protein